MTAHMRQKKTATGKRWNKHNSYWQGKTATIKLWDEKIIKWAKTIIWLQEI